MTLNTFTAASGRHTCCSHLPFSTNNRASPDPIEIDPDGDLRLLVGEDKVPFVVCAKTLARSARVWRTMLFGPFKESKRPEEGQGLWTVELPEDDPAAFEVVLHLVHAQPHKIPKMTVNLAFEVTVVTNKYGMTSCLWAVSKEWLEELPKSWACECAEGRAQLGRPYYTGKEPGPAECPLPPLEWLWITQELGDLHRYQATLRDFALQTDEFDSTSPGGLVIYDIMRDEASPPLVEDDSCFSRSANIIRPQFVCDSLDQIRTARLEALEMLVAPWAKDSRVLEDCITEHQTIPSTGWRYPTHKFVCQATGALAESRVMCDMSMSFALGAWKVGNDDFSYPLTPITTQYMCPWNLCHHLDENGGWVNSDAIRDALGPEHQVCHPWKSPQRSLEELWFSVGKISDQKVAYMLEQAKLSGLRREEGTRSGVKRTYNQME